MNVPEGYTQRPLRLDEAPAVTAVVMAEQLVDLGEVIIEEADIIGDWQRPSFDVGASAVGVFQADQLVAYAEVSGPDRGAAAVRPEHRGRGLGTALAITSAGPPGCWLSPTARTSRPSHCLRGTSSDKPLMANARRSTA